MTPNNSIRNSNSNEVSPAGKSLRAVLDNNNDNKNNCNNTSLIGESLVSSTDVSMFNIDNINNFNPNMKSIAASGSMGNGRVLPEPCEPKLAVQPSSPPRIHVQVSTFQPSSLPYCLSPTVRSRGALACTFVAPKPQPHNSATNNSMFQQQPHQQRQLAGSSTNSMQQQQQQQQQASTGSKQQQQQQQRHLQQQPQAGTVDSGLRRKTKEPSFKERSLGREYTNGLWHKPERHTVKKSGLRPKTTGRSFKERSLGREYQK